MCVGAFSAGKSVYALDLMEMGLSALSMAKFHSEFNGTSKRDHFAL